MSQKAKKQYKILYALVTKKHSLSSLSEETGIPKTTVSRQIRKLQQDFFMKIVCLSGEEGNLKRGYLFITDWGIINQNAFLKRYGEERTALRPQRY